MTEEKRLLFALRYGRQGMRHRKYCTVHDSLWEYDDRCETAAVAWEKAGVTWGKPEPCKFIDVNLVPLRR